MTKKTTNYQESTAELNEILQDLQSENVDVDQLSAKVKRATDLIKICREKIQKTELEVKKIIKKFEKEEEQGEKV